MLRLIQLLCIGYLACLFMTSAYSVSDLQAQVYEETYLPRVVVDPEPQQLVSMLR